MIKIWDLRKLQCVKTLHGHRGWVKNIEFLDEVRGGGRRAG